MKYNTKLLALALAVPMCLPAPAQTIPQTHPRSLGIYSIWLAVGNGDVSLAELTQNGRQRLYDLLTGSVPALLGRDSPPTLADTVQSWGQRQGADFVLQTSITDFKVKTEDVFLGFGKRVTVRVSVSAQVFDSTRHVIATYGATGTSSRVTPQIPLPWGDVIKQIWNLIQKGSDQPETALAFAMKSLANQVRRDIGSYAVAPLAPVVDGSSSQLHVSGLADLAAAKEFLNTVRSMPGITTADLVSFHSGTVAAEIHFDGSKLKDLSDLAQAPELAKYKLVIDSFEKANIEAHMGA